MRKILMSLLCLLLVFGLFGLPLHAQEPVSTEAPGELIIESVVEEEFNNGAEVLLVKDVDPWDVRSNEIVLESLGKSYDVINSTNLCTHDLGQYKMLIYASDQPTTYYQNLAKAACIDKIEAYVAGGGKLLGHVCDQGWQGGSWSSLHILPGNLGHDNYFSQGLSISLPEECVVQGIDNAYLQNWNFSTHGELILVDDPKINNMKTVIANATVQGSGPTWVQYCYGAGCVYATMQTSEWGYSHQSRPQLLLNEISCLQDCECYLKVDVDIKPGSCPNPLNLKSKGVLPVAVLGTEEFDVTTIDPLTILLSREEVEEGVGPIRSDYEDVATPFEGELCDCHDLDGDGYLDLTLKFKTQDLVVELKLDEVAGDEIPLTLTGNLRESEDGTPIKGADCIWVLDVPKGRK
jgi:hypothetical protein